MSAIAIVLLRPLNQFNLWTSKHQSLADIGGNFLNGDALLNVTIGMPCTLEFLVCGLVCRLVCGLVCGSVCGIGDNRFQFREQIDAIGSVWRSQYDIFPNGILLESRNKYMLTESHELLQRCPGTMQGDGQQRLGLGVCVSALCWSAAVHLSRYQRKFFNKISNAESPIGYLLCVKQYLRETTCFPS